MAINISKGKEENGVVIGNTYDKYSTRNPIERRLMRGYQESLEELVCIAKPQSIHEVGCGEGYWMIRWAEEGYSVHGTDFSTQVIAIAKQNAIQKGIPEQIFEPRSIYELDPKQDSADLVVCCEVLEHLDDPERGLLSLKTITRSHLILSVPREPIWRILNLARGKYWNEQGNTPGHIQHWSRSGFIQLVKKHFKVIETRSPLPWTMVLCRP